MDALIMWYFNTSAKHRKQEEKNKGQEAGGRWEHLLLYVVQELMSFSILQSTGTWINVVYYISL